VVQDKEKATNSQRNYPSFCEEGCDHGILQTVVPHSTKIAKIFLRPVEKGLGKCDGSHGETEQHGKPRRDMGSV
jgi:hypothetical protein